MKTNKEILYVLGNIDENYCCNYEKESYNIEELKDYVLQNFKKEIENDMVRCVKGKINNCECISIKVSFDKDDKWSPVAYIFTKDDWVVIKGR